MNLKHKGEMSFLNNRNMKIFHIYCVIPNYSDVTIILKIEYSHAVDRSYCNSIVIKGDIHVYQST